jgi:hypothetical protein
MRFGLNLRGDLAKLSNTEIASTFERLLSEREKLYAWLPSYGGNKWLYQKGLLKQFGRGPLHARVFYKIIGSLNFSSFRRPNLRDLYLYDCEIKDIRDEIQRRVMRNKSEMNATT